MAHDQPSSSGQVRVLCIIETLGRGGGAEQLVASLAAPLRARGIEVEFVDLFSWPDDLGQELERDGFVVHRLGLGHRWNLVRGFERLRALVLARRPAIVWGHLYFGNLYSSLLGLCFPNLASVITLHSTGLAQMSPRGVKGRFSNALEQGLNRRAKIKVAVSDAVRDAYSRHRNWTDVQVIHNGIDAAGIPDKASESDRARIRGRFHVNEDDFLITVPARFVPEKGHDVFLNAVVHLGRQHALHPKLLLIGLHTPLVAALQTQCMSLGIHEDQLRFVQPVPRQELLSLLGCSDVVVLPSVQEAFGLAAVEAMAMEAPVILSRVGGMTEIDPSDECVVYVQPGDAGGLGDAMALLMQDRPGRLERGRRGGRIVRQQFGLDRCASKWHQLFVKALARDVSPA